MNRVDESRPGLVVSDWIFRPGLSPKERQQSGPAAAAAAAATSSETGDRLAEQEEPARVVFIAAGWAHSLAVTNHGAVFSWGCGVDGRLGHGSHANQFLPKQIRALAAPELPVVQVAAGYAHSLFRTRSGALFGCGYNKFGQVGLQIRSSGHDIGGVTLEDNGTSSAGLQAPSESLAPPGSEVAGAGAGGGRRGPKTLAVLVPLRIMGGIGHRPITHVSAGDNHSAAVSQPDLRGEAGPSRVYTWGLNLGNQCGLGRGCEHQETPQEVSLLAGATRLSAGAAHTALVM